MKFRKHSFLLVFILFFALLALCTADNKKIKPDQARNIIKKMIMKEGMEKDIKKMQSLADQIRDDNDQLRSFFKEGDFVSIAKLYKKHGATLVTPGYKKICGKDSAAFWKRARQEGAKLRFETVNIYLSDVTGEKTVQVRLIDSEGKMKIEDRIYDTVAFVLHEIHIVTEKEGEVVHNATLLESRNYLHQDRCPWF